MMRDAHPTCAACGAGLGKTGADWYVCDQCHHVLIPSEDVTAQLNEVALDDLRPVEERLFEIVRERVMCPRCTTTMIPYVLYDAPFDQCPAHGLWTHGMHLAHALAIHAQRYRERNPEVADVPAIGILTAIPIVNLFVAIPANALVLPWLRRRRRRAYLAASTPKPKTVRR